MFYKLLHISFFISLSLMILKQNYFLRINYLYVLRACVRDLDLRVQSVLYKREFWASKSAGFNSTKILEICGCKRQCPKDLRVHAPTAPVLTHSMSTEQIIRKSNICETNSGLSVWSDQQVTKLISLIWLTRLFKRFVFLTQHLLWNRYFFTYTDFS